MVITVSVSYISFLFVEPFTYTCISHEVAISCVARTQLHTFDTSDVLHLVTRTLLQSGVT